MLNACSVWDATEIRSSRKKNVFTKHNWFVDLEEKFFQVISHYGGKEWGGNRSKYMNMAITLIDQIIANVQTYQPPKDTREKKKKHAHEALQNKTASTLYIYSSPAHTRKHTHTFSLNFLKRLCTGRDFDLVTQISRGL